MMYQDIFPGFQFPGNYLPGIHFPRSESPSGSSQSETETEAETGTGVLTKPQAKEPRLYKVVLLNDDYTPMDFVVSILKEFFGKTPTEANQIMLEIHHQGSGLAGIFPFEIAEMKMFQVHQQAKKNQYPLKCVLERQ